jgi:hypothetical protein
MPEVGDRVNATPHKQKGQATATPEPATIIEVRGGPRGLQYLCVFESRQGRNRKDRVWRYAGDIPALPDNTVEVGDAFTVPPRFGGTVTAVNGATPQDTVDVEYSTRINRNLIVDRVHRPPAYRLNYP